MTIETDNLILRDYTSEDIDALYPIMSDADTMSFWPAPFSRDDVQRWIDRAIASYHEYGYGRYPIILKENEKVIGDCGIFRTLVAGEPVNDLGYILHKDYWGKGYATEAAAAVMRDAFDRLKLESLHANMPYNHSASRRVAERLGMHKVREFTNERNRNIWTLLYCRGRGDLSLERR
jgi:RimJ/RimL family protein N-acetyltransferase